MGPLVDTYYDRLAAGHQKELDRQAREDELAERAEEAYRDELAELVERICRGGRVKIGGQVIVAMDDVVVQMLDEDPWGFDDALAALYRGDHMAVWRITGRMRRAAHTLLDGSQALSDAIRNNEVIIHE